MPRMNPTGLYVFGPQPYGVEGLISNTLMGNARPQHPEAVRKQLQTCRPSGVSSLPLGFSAPPHGFLRSWFFPIVLCQRLTAILRVARPGLDRINNAPAENSKCGTTSAEFQEREKAQRNTEKSHAPAPQGF